MSALPAFLKTWNFAGINQRISFVSLNDTMASLLFKLKDYLVVTLGAAQTTTGFTSDGTTGPTSATDHTDRWVTKANATTRGLIATSNSMSWAVIPWAGAQLLLAYQGASDDVARIAFSQTASYRPASAAASFVFTVASIPTDTLNAVAHGQVTGDGPFWATTTTTLPAPLVTTSPYWIIRVDNDNFKLAASRALALLGTAIDITTAGTGTQTLTNPGSKQLPFADDEVPIAQSISLINSSPSLDRVVSITGASDFSVFRLWCYRSNTLTTSFGLEKIAEAPGITVGTVLGWNSNNQVRESFGVAGHHAGGTSQTPGAVNSMGAMISGTQRILDGATICFKGSSANMPLVGPLVGSSPVWPLLVGCLTNANEGWVGTRIDGFVQSGNINAVAPEGAVADDTAAGTRLLWAGTMMTPWSTSAGLVRA